MGWNSKLAVMGKPSSDNKVFLQFDDLVSLCSLDCGQTLYSLEGKVNRRRFGVPMGGFMSPQLARMYCATTDAASASASVNDDATVCRTWLATDNVLRVQC